jgi:hypothetical protein
MRTKVIFRKRMEEVFIITAIITVSFCLSKYIEYKYFTEDIKPLKDIVRDCLLVLMCAVSGSYVYFHFQTTFSDFFNVVTETKVLNNATTQVFTDSPTF